MADIVDNVSSAWHQDADIGSSEYTCKDFITKLLMCSVRVYNSNIAHYKGQFTLQPQKQTNADYSTSLLSHSNSDSASSIAENKLQQMPDRGNTLIRQNPTKCLLPSVGAM